ncbi:MAG: adenosylmethionine--8-amino-7-oxononanoate transaminase [Thermodesulfovibrionales bacterium]
MGVEEEYGRLAGLDKARVWHPFTQMREWAAEDPLIVSEGRGCFLKDTRGRWYLDGVSSLWVNIHGHRRREIDDAIRAQLDRVAHSTLLGQGNVPSIELAGRLVEAVADSLSGGTPVLTRVFYSDNGSTAVEVALKMAFQYWRLRGQEGRDSFVSLENGYHGDTLGAVSVGGVDLFHSAYRPLLFKAHKAPSPYCYRCGLGLRPESCSMACLGKMEDILRERGSEIAAVIVEPLVQAAGGMIVAPRGYLRGVRGLCAKYGVLMIADEVATGFGRTGRMFACEHEGVVPDIICLSKGITGGYLPLAATVATEEVYEAFLGEFRELKTFFHGHSYTGNQLGCAAALASLDIFRRDRTLERLGPKIGLLEGWLEEARGLPHVGDARNAGFICGVELVRDKASREPYPFEEKMGYRVAWALRERGVLIRPLGNVLVIMPPLAIEAGDLETMLRHVAASIEEVTERQGAASAG